MNDIKDKINDKKHTRHYESEGSLKKLKEKQIEYDDDIQKLIQEEH